MDSPESIGTALATSGPLALVLGVAVKVLWGKVQQLEVQLSEERARFDREKDKLHNETKDLYASFNKTLENSLKEEE